MYDSIWESVFSSRSWGRYPAEDLVRFVARAVRSTKDRPSLKALELGCGPGANLWLLAREGVLFDAVDGSPTAVAQARERLDGEVPGWRGRVEVGDFCRLPADFRGYDIVIDSEALSCNNFEDSAGVIREVHERLLPGGAFWSRTFGPGTSGVETGEKIGREFWLPEGGPLAGKGGVRLTQFGSLSELYGDDWASLSVGELVRHDGDSAISVHEWIIVARKQGREDSE